MSFEEHSSFVRQNRNWHVKAKSNFTQKAMFFECPHKVAKKMGHFLNGQSSNSLARSSKCFEMLAQRTDVRLRSCQCNYKL